MFWICITQGFAIHVNQNAERLRKTFVAHEGKKEIMVRRDNFVKGDPNNNWEDVFDEFSTSIKSHIGEEIHSTIVSSFSTTGPTETAISDIVLMVSLQQYFSYSMMTMCGIPSFYLGGQKQDWLSMKSKASSLIKYDSPSLDTWGDALSSVFDEILKAYEGETNDIFWDSFYKYNHASGGAVVTGWVNVLFPYLQRGKEGVFETNALSRIRWDSKERFWGNKPNLFPMGISKVPFVWEYLGNKIDMEFVGGVVGASQNEGGVLRPEFGWAVREKFSNA